MTALLISNPPRGRNGRFKKGTRRRTKRRTTRTTSRAPAKRRRRRTTTTVARRNPPRRRRSSSGLGRKVTVRELLPQATAGVGGFMATNYGTDWVLGMMPASVTSKIPEAAGPIVKGAVAMGLGVAVSKYGPRGLRRFGTMVAAGGLISAGLEVVAMVRGGALSGYWSPDGGMAGYWSEGQPALAGPGYADDLVFDPETGTYMSGPAVIVDTRDLR